VGWAEPPAGSTLTATRSPRRTPSTGRATSPRLRPRRPEPRRGDPAAADDPQLVGAVGGQGREAAAREHGAVAGDDEAPRSPTGHRRLHGAGRGIGQDLGDAVGEGSRVLRGPVLRPGGGAGADRHDGEHGGGDEPDPAHHRPGATRRTDRSHDVTDLGGDRDLRQHPLPDPGRRRGDGIGQPDGGPAQAGHLVPAGRALGEVALEVRTLAVVECVQRVGPDQRVRLGRPELRAVAARARAGVTRPHRPPRRGRRPALGRAADGASAARRVFGADGRPDGSDQPPVRAGRPGRCPAAGQCTRRRTPSVSRSEWTSTSTGVTPGGSSHTREPWRTPPAVRVRPSSGGWPRAGASSAFEA
jgi:hypothetical protein